MRHYVSVVGSELELITRTRVPYSDTKLSVVKLEHSGGAFVHVVTPESFVSEYGTLGLVLNSLKKVIHHITMSTCIGILELLGFTKSNRLYGKLSLVY